MDMNLQKHMAFVKTVEYGSFTKAAEMLNYSQSGISRMISDLEKDWRVTLLERGKAGVKLTSDGMRLLPYAKKVCGEYEKLLMQVDEINGMQLGLIRIGTFSSVATHWLPNIIKAFQADYPKIEYELLLGDYAEIEEWVATGRVDFGFARLPVRRDSETVFLEQDRLLAILPENHPLAEYEKIPAAALCSEPFILLEKDGNSDAAEFFARCNLTPRAQFTTWDDYAIMSMVESGLGVSILPQLILRRVPYRIVTKELDVPAYRNIGLAFRSRKEVSPTVRRFLDYVKYR